ncbi:methionine ABC transporter ATP-binding protein [Nosocomiicoccus sp. HMSC067E10]|uniref:methionine ABC transporter ATP-binding protein n=1 Tax=Nosocomiicoccus sp. HMSC067E10 TaxID=1739271 RepID=UPI0008A4EEC6|nr:ATP-binding cassette domain-containing protein [Nosocomiicoccus sp. HMSC067E10]OFL49067.1 methionine ABC transporter ATP-binding protein [Nosocomiicoccus sp. HMSC067E10]
MSHIELKGVSKTYDVKGKSVEAVKTTDLSIRSGEIFGLIGFSGAGKSTLLRLINLLEVPTTGDVIVGDDNLTKLSKDKLRVKRQKIGMVFQHFNLINSKTVAENIKFVLKAAKYPKERMDARVDELLTLVGLSDKRDALPKNLSGGQKQRVGIARALANDPEVLLCDEATSALDPEITKEILKLLKEINKTLGLTIVLITHEMEVIKEIAHRVGVMSNGEIIEVDDVYNIFSNPTHEVTKGFVQEIYNFQVPPHIKTTNENRIITLKFAKDTAEENHLNQLYKLFDLNISILNGRIEYINGDPLGLLMLQVSGDEAEIGSFFKHIDDRIGLERAEIYG